MATELYNSELGTIVKFQDSGGTGEFIVSHHKYSGGKYLTALVRKNAINTPGMSSSYYLSCTSLREYLNGTYYNSIDEKVRRKIQKTSIPCANSNGTIEYINEYVFNPSATELDLTPGGSIYHVVEGSPLDFFELYPVNSYAPWNSVVTRSRETDSGSVIARDQRWFVTTSYRNVDYANPTFWIERGLTIEDDGTLSVMTPTVPPSISFGNPISGKSLTVSWGKSTFSTGSIYYELEYQVDSGVWTSAGSATTLTSKSVIIPSSGTKINFRVRARSVYNDYSDYRTGVAKNIIYNQSPSVPSSISFDDPKAGKSININCGESTDPEGDTITYVFERQIDSGSWTQVSATYNRTITDTVPGSGTYVNYRVKARDVYGSESSYRTGVKKEISYLPDITNPGIPAYKYPIPGRNMKVSWGASAVEDGSPVTYVIESLISDGSWSEIGQTQETFFEVDIPVVDSHGKTITIRVKATSGEEISSEYSTGKEEEILYHKVIRLIPWDFGTPFKARQFTKNERGQFQTLFKGSTAEYIPTGNLRLGDMPLETLIRFGSIYDEPIVWKLADVNHEGYPDNSATLITNQVIKLLCVDAKEPSNTDSSRRTFGNNRYVLSNIKTWANSDAETGAWYTPTHEYDEPPDEEHVWQTRNPYYSEAGFLFGFTEKEKASLLETNISVGKTEIDGGSNENLISKIFLASCTEVGLIGDHVCGIKFPIFYDNASRISNVTKKAIENNYDPSWEYDVPTRYFLRDAWLESSVNVYVVNGNGEINGGPADHNDGFRPLCNISADTKLDPNPNADGSYNIIWEV